MDGRLPPQSCVSCEARGVECVFEKGKATTALDFPTSSYVERLEGRVAELEAVLATRNPEDPLITDHLHKQRSTTMPTSHSQRRTSHLPYRPEDYPSSEAGPSKRRRSETSRPRKTSEPSNHRIGNSHRPVQTIDLPGNDDMEDNTPNEAQEYGPRSEKAFKDEVAAGVALLSLNSSGGAHYLGGSSGFTWAKVILNMLPHSLPPRDRFFQRPPLVFQHRKKAVPTGRPSLPNPAVASALVDAFYMHVQARYPFLDWVLLKRWLAKRHEIIPASLNKEKRTVQDRTAAFFIWMILAIGAGLLSTSHLPGVSPPEVYYEAALEHIEIITKLHSTVNIQAYLILVMYSFRCAEGPSVWHLIGLSLRMCIDLGLHRKNTLAQKEDPYNEEMRRRIFWSTFGLDRMIALSLGRPLGIDEGDVDQPLPRDLPCDLIDVPLDNDEEDSMPSVSNKQPVLTSMSSALHILRLRIIESQILRAVYRIDRKNPSMEVVHAEVDSALERLKEWIETIPKKAPGRQHAQIPCCREEWFIRKYESSRLLLLRPLTARSKPGDPYLSLLARSAASLCQHHSRSVISPPLTLSWAALHSMFLTGLTLLHAIQLDPNVIPLSESSRAIRACSNGLFVYAQHMKETESFRDVFEDLATASAEATASRPSSDHIPSQSETGVISTAGIQPGDWTAYIAEMASWMQNTNAQNNLLGLLSTMGYVPEASGRNPSQTTQQVNVDRTPSAARYAEGSPDACFTGNNAVLGLEYATPLPEASWSQMGGSADMWFDDAEGTGYDTLDGFMSR